MTWNQKDEARLRALNEERDSLMTGRSAALQTIVDALDRAQIQVTPSIVSKLIDNADAIRDALAPFDSGVRTYDDRAPSPGSIRE